MCVIHRPIDLRKEVVVVVFVCVTWVGLLQLVPAEESSFLLLTEV